MKQITNIKEPNRFRSIWALSKASFLSSLRNSTSLFFNFIFPFVFITIFGVLGGDNMKFDLGIRQNSDKSGPVYEALKSVKVLNLVENKSDKQLNDDLNKGRIAVVITLKKDGEVKVGQGATLNKYDLEIEKSAASPEGAQTILSIINDIVSQVNKSIVPADLTLVNQTEKEVQGRKFKQIDFILPGQLAFALLLNALFGISFTFVTLKKELVMKRLFASPIRKSSILIAECASKFVIAILQSIIILTVGHYVFGFTLANGWVTFLSMIALSLVGIGVFLSFGIFVAAISKTEDSVSPIANLIMMPQLFLSGAFFSIEAFPKFLQGIAKIMPMTFLNDAFRMVAFEGLNVTDVLPQIGGLIVWAFVLYTIDVLIFKWE